jgi:hypothetical protein
MKHTTESVRNKLETNNQWLIRGLVAIYNKQEADEQVARQTKKANGVGFTGVDAFILSEFAVQVIDWQEGRGKYRHALSLRQLALARKKMLKYAGQLARIANEKQEADERAKWDAAADAACGGGIGQEVDDALVQTWEPYSGNPVDDEKQEAQPSHKEVAGVCEDAPCCGCCG